MSLKSARKSTVYIVIQEYLGAGKTGKNRHITVYDMPFDTVCQRVKEAFEA